MVFSYNEYIYVCMYVHYMHIYVFVYSKMGGSQRHHILSEKSQTQRSPYLWFQFHKVPEQEIEARLVLASGEGRRILTGKGSELST